MHRETALSNGVVTGHVTDETGLRGAWREYVRLMTNPNEQALDVERTAVR